MIDPERFVTTYDGAREAEIRFAWNGKHADEFVDANKEFRKKVLEVVIEKIETVDLRIVRDVFRAETEYSKEAWGIDLRVAKLAESLLKRGGSVYLEDYLIGKSQGTDAHMACAAFQLDAKTAQEMLETATSRAKGETDEKKRRLWEYGVEFFGACVKESAARQSNHPLQPTRAWWQRLIARAAERMR